MITDHWDVYLESLLSSNFIKILLFAPLTLAWPDFGPEAKSSIDIRYNLRKKILNLLERARIGIE